MDKYAGYTLGLALFDYVPVFLSAYGIWLLTKWIRASGPFGNLARFGGMMVISGGLMKATWKLLVVVAEIDVRFLYEQLFVFLGIGFVILSMATVQTLSSSERTRRPWLAPVSAVILLALGGAVWLNDPEARTWYFTFLGITTWFNLLLMGRLIGYSWKGADKLAAALLIGNIICAFTQTGLARMPEQTALLQWIEQGLNCFAQGFFMIAVIRITRKPVTSDTARMAD